MGMHGTQVFDKGSGDQMRSCQRSTSMYFLSTTGRIFFSLGKRRIRALLHFDLLQNMENGTERIGRTRGCTGLHSASTEVLLHSRYHRSHVRFA